MAFLYVLQLGHWYVGSAVLGPVHGLGYLGNGKVGMLGSEAVSQQVQVVAWDSWQLCPVCLGVPDAAVAVSRPAFPPFSRFGGGKGGRQLWQRNAQKGVGLRWSVACWVMIWRLALFMQMHSLEHVKGVCNMCLQHTCKLLMSTFFFLCFLVLPVAASFDRSCVTFFGGAQELAWVIVANI